MAMLPIVERELRVGARNKALLRARMMVPLMGTVMLVFFVWSTRFGVPTQAVAKQMFYFCFVGLFAGCLFSGVRTTADTISSEKRDGTLGFLFLTDLRGHDVVLGKLVSSSIAGVYSFLSLLPVVSVIFLFGGVEWGEVFRVVLTSGNALFFSLSAGLLASILMLQEKHARSLASAIIFAVTVFGPLVGLCVLWLSGGWTQGQTMVFWRPFLLASPIGAFTSSISNVLGSGWESFLISNGILHTLGWVALLFGCYLAPLTWQEKGRLLPEGGLRSRGMKWLAGSPELNQLRRSSMLEVNAIYWLANRERWQGWAIWGKLGLILAGIVGFGCYFGVKVLVIPLAAVFVACTNAVLKLSMIAEAGRWITRDRQSGVLELILTTPMKVEEILEGQRLALSRLYRWPFIVGGLLELIFVQICIMLDKSVSVGDALLCAGGAILWFAIMALDFKAITWVGMWHAISVTPIEKARPQTLNAVLFQPWWIFYLLMIVISPIARNSSWVIGMVLWPVLMVGMSVWQQRRAKMRLLAEFRVRAMERYSVLPAHPWWSKAGRFVAQCCYWISERKRKI